MITNHVVIVGDSAKTDLPDDSIHLVVTSPPYPMIQMWDDLFFTDDACKTVFGEGRYDLAYRRMHAVLLKTWRECARVLVPGGTACINVGDACRSLDGIFRVWPNHASVISAFGRLGFDCLPPIHWRKPTNKPTKFMGSGMLPGAYVTSEEEYILIFRKPGRRKWDPKVRRHSAFFWEERNTWFSDSWDVRGVPQRVGGPRERSAAFPLEIPLRLIWMYSAYGDTVLDPFCGTNTTGLAAALAGRNSVGYDILEFSTEFKDLKLQSEKLWDNRIKSHVAAIKGRKIKYVNQHYGFGVVTNQERDLYLYKVCGTDGSTVRYD